MGPSTHSLHSGSGGKPGVGICTCLVTAHYISQGELDSDKTSGTNIHAMACFTSKGIAGCWGQIHCHQGREKGPGDRSSRNLVTYYLIDYHLECSLTSLGNI